MDVNQLEQSSDSAADVAHVASCVGHHVINAFAAVVSNAELLKLALEKRTALDTDALATTIIRAALDASQVARRLIDFSRPITDPGPGMLRLDRFLAEYFAERREQFPGIEWRTELDEVPEIHGNPEQLRHMLDYLIENALEASEDRGVPVVTARIALDKRRWIEFELEDGGAGMTPEMLERAVEPFYSTKYGHAGVGLSIANRIWRRHGGTLSIRSRASEGTTLRLCVDPQHGGRIGRPIV